MKLLSLALVACVAVTGYTYAQTAAQAPAPPTAASTPASSSPSTGSQSLGHACKEEVKKLCGRANAGLRQKRPGSQQVFRGLQNEAFAVS
jgi:hypothetical protein